MKAIKLSILAFIISFSFISSTYAYIEYGAITLSEARQKYSGTGVELVHGVKVFGDISSLSQYGITKEAMVDLDNKLNEYTAKTGNFVGIALFGKGSSCKGIGECKELNMAVKGLSDNGVVIAIMDNGNFKRNMSVIADPNIKDFFNSYDETKVIDTILKPSLISNTANAGLVKSTDYVIDKLGSVSVIVAREERIKKNAELAKKRAEEAKILAAEKLRIEAENLKKQEERNKKIQEMLYLGLKGAIGLFIMYIIYLIISYIYTSISFSFTKKRIFKLISEGNVTANVLNILIKDGDVEADNKELSKYNVLKSKIENSGIEEFSVNKSNSNKIKEYLSDLEAINDEMNKLVDDIGKEKLSINDEIMKGITEFDKGNKEVQEKITEIDNAGIKNIIDEKNSLIKKVNEYIDGVAEIKEIVKNELNDINLLKKRDIVRKLYIMLEEMKGDVNSSIFRMNDIIEKVDISQDNKNKLQDITSIDL